MTVLTNEIGSEFDRDSNVEFIDPDMHHEFLSNAELFRSGRDALRAIACTYKDTHKRIVLPALCCNSMISSFEIYGYSVSYTILNSDLTVDVNYLLTNIRNNDILLYMNYFGIQSISDESLALIKQKFPSLIIIEDKTHDFFSIKVNKFIPDFTVCSIRKWLGIPDGGLLYKQNLINYNIKNNDNYFSELRTEAMKNKSNYLYKKDIKIKELFRSQFAEASEYLENDNRVIEISMQSYSILRKTDLKKIISIRFENIIILSEKIKVLNNIKTLIEPSESKVVLYYPILVENRNYIQKRLSESGVYCPVIWPLEKQAEKLCVVSNGISQNMLALPCDHRYRPSDMEYIINSLQRILGE